MSTARHAAIAVRYATLDDCADATGPVVVVDVIRAFTDERTDPTLFLRCTQFDRTYPPTSGRIVAPGGRSSTWVRAAGGERRTAV